MAMPKKTAYYTLTPTLTNEVYDSLSPQCKQLVDILRENPRIERQDLLAKMITVITTSQEIYKILAFYQRHLVQFGCLDIERVKAEKKPRTGAKSRKKSVSLEEVTPTEEPSLGEFEDTSL
jgi:hypothetical protein